MGTCGRRGIVQALLRSRWLGLSLLMVLAGLSLPVPAGENWASVSQLIIPPAEASKARSGPRHRRHTRLLDSAFGPPVFAPPRHESAVHPPIGGFDAFRPPRHGRSFKAQAFALPKQGWVVRRLAKARKGPLRASPKPTPPPSARTDVRTSHAAFTRRVGVPAVGERWEARVHLAAVELRGDLDVPSRSARTPHVARPPDAYHRILGKLSKHSRRLRKEARPPSRTKDAAPVARRPGPMVRRLGSRPVGELLPPIGSFKPNEVLAINLSPEGLAKVRDGSYEPAGRIELPEFGLTITRLRTPETLNAVSGWGRLYDLLPEGGFALNRIYAPYRLGAGPGSAGTGGRSAAQGNGCAADRCFGAALINWQASLAACARGVKVGVVDTGFDRGHPAFAGLRYDYKEFLSEGRARASDQHGTGVLSLLAGNPASGTPGLIPDAHFVVANAFFADSDGQAASDTAQMLQALHWLKRSGVAVVNLSFAGPPDDLMHHGVQQLTKAGIVVVAAAGNEGPSAPPSYPAAYEEVIAVTAVDRNLAPYRYATRGDHIDVAAPGVEVWTAFPGRREGPQTGTSFAVPYVTAIVAVADPGAGPPQLDADPLAASRRALALLNRDAKRLSDRSRDPTFGAGLVQAPALCDAVATSTVAAADPWAGTVRRVVLHAAPREPLLVGAWVSTVHTASGNEVPR